MGEAAETADMELLKTTLHGIKLLRSGGTRNCLVQGIPLHYLRRGLLQAADHLPPNPKELPFLFNGVSIYILGWPGTHYVVPASASQVVGLQACTPCYAERFISLISLRIEKVKINSAFD